MAYKINNEAVIQDDNRVFNNGCTYITDSLQSPTEGDGFFWGAIGANYAASGNYQHPWARTLAITNPLTGYALGDTNNDGSINLTDVLNFQKYWLELSTPPDTLYYANRFIGPAPSNGFSQSDEDAGGYFVGWSDEDAYRVLELYVNSGTPAWVTQAFTDSNILAYADIDDNGSVNSSDLTAARNVINGSTTNTAQNANFYKFKALVCGKHFNTSGTSSSAMWGRGLVGTGNGFQYVGYQSQGSLVKYTREISGTKVESEALIAHGKYGDGFDYASTKYGLYGPEGKIAGAADVASYTILLPDHFVGAEECVFRVDFHIMNFTNGAYLWIDPQNSSGTNINVWNNYRSSYSSSDQGGYNNNYSGGIRCSNYGYWRSSFHAISGTMLIYYGLKFGYTGYEVNTQYMYNGGYPMQGFAVGNMATFGGPNRLRFRMSSGNLDISTSVTPVAKMYATDNG